MTSSDPQALAQEIEMLADRVRESPQLVVEYVRLARLLEESGDDQGAVSVLRSAHFFLPNGPSIIAELQRLSGDLDFAKPPVVFAPQSRIDESEMDDETVAEEPVEFPADLPPEDDLDRLIEGLQESRMDPRAATPADQTPEWSDDDGLIATETLAQIYAAQKQFEEAARVYLRLAEMEKDPARAEEMRIKAAELQAKLRDSS